METKGVQESNFTLPNEQVVVKFIPRKTGMAANVADNHIIAGGMLPKAVKKYMAPLQKNGSIANVLTKEEKAYIESITGLNLSVYGDFWTEFTVSLFKEDSNNKFDLSNPMDYISIKILETLSNDIAKNWSERNDRQTYNFVITKGEEVNKESKSRLDVKTEAFTTYARIKDDKDKLVSILKLMSKLNISPQSTLDWVQGKVQEYVDTEPKQFLAIINDTSFETKALINKAVDANIILRKGNKYSTIDGLELSENNQLPSFINAVKYLDNDKNQEVRTLIEARLNSEK